MLIAAAILLAGTEIARAIHLHRNPNWEYSKREVFWIIVFSLIIIGGMILHFATLVVRILHN